MIRLEDIQVNSRIKGIERDGTVSIIAVARYDTDAFGVTYRDQHGHLGERLLFRKDEVSLQFSEQHVPWTFSADANEVRLVSEAYRIHLAHLSDPYHAVFSSDIDPLPHQITAVYEKMLSQSPLRFVLADDPGAGKTIMTGLLLKELIVRSDVKRCLIVTPGSLSEQWQEELSRKFDLRFEIMTNDRFTSSHSGNSFNETDLCIARLDKLARDDRWQDKLEVSSWDIVVCDEAHKMSASFSGEEVKKTKRYRLGERLSALTRHFLLLTATPHNGKEGDFQLFMSLVDRDRFAGKEQTEQESNDLSDYMRRMVKEELLTFEGKPLFPERIATTINYDLSPQESTLYNQVTEYVQDEFNRADNLNKKRKITVGFALTILQRRLASSPEAIYQSLHRRRMRLNKQLNDERIGQREFMLNEYDLLDDYDEDDYSDNEREQRETDITDLATAAKTIAELEAEIAALERLEKLANDLRKSGVDRKWEELSRLLQDETYMQGEHGRREKIIIFTEHRDTLQYLVDKISTLLGDPDAVVTIHGGLSRDMRRRVQEQFSQDKQVRILVATDAAGEGINLQRAHLMVNYDLPWNPNRLEQRFGRIHRIGQKEICYLWNLVAKNTREGLVFQRLFEKIENEKDALQGKVFDVLGKLTFDNKSLRDLLIEAIRRGNDPEVRERINKVVDSAFSPDKIRDLLVNHALANETIHSDEVLSIREEMERIKARRLQPHFIESFFLDAFRRQGGIIERRENNRYEIQSVPSGVMSRDTQIGRGDPILRRYERVCFDRADIYVPDRAMASLIAPGHPLLASVIDLTRQELGPTLKQGTIFVDEMDMDKDVRIMFFIENTICDGVTENNGQKRVVAQNLHFVEMNNGGILKNAGYAPYLNYRAVAPNELDVVKSIMDEQNWLKDDIEIKARNYAISEIIPKHLESVKKRRLVRIEKTRRAVASRLLREITRWQKLEIQYQADEELGIANASQNRQRAKQYAEEFKTRLRSRQLELDRESQIVPLPPKIVGGSVVIPIGAIANKRGKVDSVSADAESRRIMELAAMNAIMSIERAKGYYPRDVSAENCGYDIESRIPKHLQTDDYALRMIEVKGRMSDARSVTVTKNEILVALNQPEQHFFVIVRPESHNAVYLQRAFKKVPDFAATSVNFDINKLIASAEVVIEESYELQEKAD